MTLALKTKIQAEFGSAAQFDGYGYRNVSQKYATQSQIQSVKGSLDNGARFNFVGAFGALYLSSSWDTCFIETLKSAGSHANVTNTLPRTVIGFRVSCFGLLDLTSDATLSRIGVTKVAILDTDWKHEQDINGVEALTQTIGRYARESGFSGLLAPSAADPGGSNVVLFPDRVRSPSRFSVINLDHLLP